MAGKILLVDDDRIFRSEFKECFQEYGIIEAASGQEALKIFRRPNEIDLVILDVRMSGMNGIETLNQIKKISPEVSIVILTGYGSKDVAVEALRGKASDYIEKPLDIEATREVIEKILKIKNGEEDISACDARGKVGRVKAFLQRNSFKKVTLQDAAGVVCLSPKYLSRIFKQYAGRDFNEYKLTLKIAEAKALLTKTGYNINQISDKLGYENPESFIRIFKKITRQTPTAYRNKIKKKNKISKKKSRTKNKRKS
jgi:YesN/AraC family two-component response regulator